MVVAKLWWGFIVKILQKIYETPLILLHVACRKTQLKDVRPNADLSWKSPGLCDDLQWFPYKYLLYLRRINHTLFYPQYNDHQLMYHEHSYLTHILN